MGRLLVMTVCLAALAACGLPSDFLSPMLTATGSKQTGCLDRLADGGTTTACDDAGDAEPESRDLLPCIEEGGACVGEPQSSACAHPLALSCGVNNAGLSCCLDALDADADLDADANALDASGCIVEVPPDVVQDPLCTESTGGVCVVNPPACCEIAGTCTLGGTPGAVCCVPTPQTPAACAAAGGQCVFGPQDGCAPVGPKMCGTPPDAGVCCAE